VLDKQLGPPANMDATGATTTAAYTQCVCRNGKHNFKLNLPLSVRGLCADLTISVVPWNGRGGRLEAMHDPHIGPQPMA
jgi:hypothetical protein